MLTRRTLLTVVTVTAGGCLAPGDSTRGTDRNGENGETDPQSDADENNTDDEPGYYLRAAPVTVNDREPVLSTDDDAVAEIEPLVDLLEEVADTVEVKYASLSPSDAEAFEEVIAGVERYPAGNPPGYYIEHESLVVSVSRSG